LLICYSFFFVGLSLLYILDRKLVELTWVDLGFFNFFLKHFTLCHLIIDLLFFPFCWVGNMGVVSLGFFLILEREVEYEGSFDLFFSHFVFPLSLFFVCVF